MVVTSLRRSDDDRNPLSGFDQCESLMGKIYLLQVKARSQTLDDALYNLAHLDSPDATSGGSHAEVVEALHTVADIWPEYADIARELTDQYQEEHSLS